MSEEGTVRCGEFKAVRESLSLTAAAMAELLSVSEGTIKNWEKGKYAPPAGVAAEVGRLEEYTRRCVDAVVETARSRDEPMVVVWRLSDEMPQGPAGTLGAAWWRAVAARARERVAGLEVGYPDELDRLTGSRGRTLGEAIGPSILPPP